LSDELEGAECTAENACYLPISVRTGNPIIGKLRDGLWVASGHSCWGITLGPGTGKVMSELLMDGKATSADIGALSP
jgi:glycine/D-amino acid oxidase-like deaminating enzyme